MSKPFTLGAILRNSSSATEKEYKNIPMKFLSGKPKNLPTNFDGRIKWNGLLTKVIDQGTCGNCWAIACTTALQDRFVIQSNNQIKLELNPDLITICNFTEAGDKKEDEMIMELVNNDKKCFDCNYIADDPTICAKELGCPVIDNKKWDEIETEINKWALDTTGCKGNTIVDGWKYLFRWGTTDTKCIPREFNKKNWKNLSEYQTSLPKDIPLCKDLLSVREANWKLATCFDGHPLKTYRCSHIYTINGSKKDGGNEYEIRLEIYRWGPISTGFMVYEDFLSFFSENPTGVYQYDGKSSEIGGHAIVIVGWGETNSGMPYWICRNSWGEKWGDNGYFRILRGKDHCMIEENAIVGIPDIVGLREVQGVAWLETKEDKEKRESMKQDLFGYSDLQYKKFLVGELDLDLHIPYDFKKLPDTRTFWAGEHTFLVSSSNGYKIKIPIIPITIGVLLILIFIFRKRLSNIFKKC